MIGATTTTTTIRDVVTGPQVVATGIRAAAETTVLVEAATDLREGATNPATIQDQQLLPEAGTMGSPE